MKGKNVVITGASAGIGAACAEVFAQNGANLVLTARRIEKLQKNAEALKKSYNVNIHTIQMDVRNYEQVKYEFENLPVEFQDRKSVV